MNQLKGPAGVQCTALSDVDEPWLLQAAETAGPLAAKVSDYRAVLASRDVDAVLRQ